MEIKKYTFNQALFFIAAVVSLAACKKENAANASSINLPVVEAYLIPGNTITVKLYQQKGITDTAKYGHPITGMQIYITDGSKKVLLTESTAGTYTYADKTFLVAGDTYTMQFNYLTSIVSAKTVMPSKPTNFKTSYGAVDYPTTQGSNSTVLDRLSWDNPDSLNHVLVFLNADEKDFPTNSFGNANRPYDFELNTYQASFYNLTANVFPYLGPYQIILFRVNKEYINLINSNTGNSTSSSLNNVPTNVINGLGIFTAMQADTVSLSIN